MYRWKLNIYLSLQQESQISPAMKVAICLVLLLGLALAASFKNTTNFFSKELGSNLTIQTFSGYEDIDWFYPDKSASIYYSLWQGSYLSWQDHNVPLIIWLQGGPGGASQFGCFNEVGPLHIQDVNGTNKIIETAWGWNHFGHLLCIDQPIGVGFSINNGNPIVDNTPQAANHFVNFLFNFFKNSPFDLIKNPLYLAGQSYAGHYIPAFAQKIAMNMSLGFNLRGVMIGDGYVDPEYQINNYDSFLYAAGVAPLYWRDTTTFMQNQALTRIMNGDLANASGYINFIIANDTVAGKYYNGMNVLNYKLYDNSDFNENYAKFLEANKAEFGVPTNKTYVDDYQEMYYAFNADLSRSFKPQLERVLNLDIKTLIYNGQNDFIVNTAGVLTYMNTLKWKYAKQWREAKKTMWKDYDDFTNLGWTKNYGNLYFTLIRNAGHLVPSDQPRVAWTMLNNYFKQ